MEPESFAPAGRRPGIARARTLLPALVSPISPTRWPGPMARLTPLSAATPSKLTPRLSTLSCGICVLRISPPCDATRDEGEGDDHQHEDQPGDHHQQRLGGDVRLRVMDHQPQARGGGLAAKAHIAEARLP